MRKQKWVEGADGEEQADSVLRRKPDSGLSPRTLRSLPEPKVDAQLIEPPEHSYNKYSSTSVCMDIGFYFF